jgi:hypothetical protein
MHHQYPNIIRMSPQWFKSLNEVQAGLPDGSYVPSRPLGWASWLQRWRAAWLVFTGRADALLWPGQ